VEIVALSYLAAFIAALVLSIYLFLRKPENTAREIFSIFLFLAALSSLMLFYSHYSISAVRLVFLKAYLAIFLFSLFVLLHFTFVLADKKFYLAYYIFPFTMLVLALFTDLFIRPVDALTMAFTGSLIFFAEAYAAVLSIFGIYMLGSIYSKIKSKKLRRKLMWVSLGLTILLGGIVLSFILRKLNSPFTLPFHYAVCLMSLFVAYPFVRGDAIAR